MAVDADKTIVHVVVHHEDGSYWAEVSEMPGCFAAASTREELDEALAEAISLWVADDDTPAPPVEITAWLDITSTQELTVRGVAR